MASASVSNNSREYCLRWNNHQPNMATYFGNLYNSESLVDVTLVSSEGSKILAHKLVLSACSSYFQHIFESNPCKHPVVILKDVQHSDLEAIVKFIYNGEVNISQDRMTHILKTANSLQVKGLAEVPAEELKRVSSVVGNNSDRDSSNNLRTHKNPSLATSLSWDNSDSANDIPRKKLKKSASTSASYMSAGGLANTNGDHHSGSIDSGVGASVSKSMDESQGDETPSPSVVQKRISFPGPPPLLPKSRSLDIHRDMHDDHDMNPALAEHHQRQSYDDSSVGFDRGYDLEVAEGEEEEMGLKMGVGVDGEYEEDGEEMGYYEENEEYYDDEEFDDGSYEDHVTGIRSLNGKLQMPFLKASQQSSSNINSNQVRDILQASSLRFSNGPVFRRRSERQVMDPERLEKAMEFLRNGATYREAAAKFGFSKTYLWHRSRQHGVTSRKPGIRPLGTVRGEDVEDHSSDNQESNEATPNPAQDFETTSDPSSVAETHWATQEVEVAESVGVAVAVGKTPTTRVGQNPIPSLTKGVSAAAAAVVGGGGSHPRVKFLPNPQTQRRFIHPHQNQTSQS